ncbi:MAG: VWA domain-containing protein [Acidimicrobiia bacterium]|nr:VWA domain-containing protein [Acidimicrobiia bacterium]
MTETASTDHKPPVHISIVLDRSGSMAAIADDIVGGFNEYLSRQRDVQGDARMSLVQFDSQDPFEVVFDGLDLHEVRPLDRHSYAPRGSTPLFDAVGRMIARIDRDIVHRRTHALPEEDQVVVVITDGLENASREHDRASIFALVEQHRQLGWVFTFLGADQDAYAEGRRMGVAGTNTAGWEKSGAGVRKMYDDLEYSTRKHREKAAMARKIEADVFHQERKPGA